MPDTKEYREVSRSSTSEDAPFLGEIITPHQSKFRRTLSRLLLPLVVHGTIMVIYLALLTLVFNKTGSRKYCHSPLVYCKDYTGVRTTLS